MQIYFHNCLCSYLPRVPIFVEGTVCESIEPQTGLHQNEEKIRYKCNSLTLPTSLFRRDLRLYIHPSHTKMSIVKTVDNKKKKKSPLCSICTPREARVSTCLKTEPGWSTTHPFCHPPPAAGHLRCHRACLRWAARLPPAPSS